MTSRHRVPSFEFPTGTNYIIVTIVNSHLTLLYSLVCHDRPIIEPNYQNV